MPAITRFDHIGITVADLDAVTAFFVGLGLEVEGRMFIEGEFLDTVIGMRDARTEIVMLRPPDDRYECSAPPPPPSAAGFTHAACMFSPCTRPNRELSGGGIVERNEA